MSEVGAAGSFEVDKVELAVGTTAHEQGGASPLFRCGVGLLRLTAVEWVAPMTLAGQRFEVGPLDTALFGAQSSS
jgi:hypothetical protein